MSIYNLGTNIDKPSLPQVFKGIALFTPGGDLIYCIDPSKQKRWHLHLCGVLQEILNLSEPPHFLVPCYTATIDHWLNPRTQKIQTFAEAYPAVMSYQPVLGAIFGTGNEVWQRSPWREDVCDPMVIESYRSTFPQLWEDHDLIVRLDSMSMPYSQKHVNQKQIIQNHEVYVLRLFVAGHNISTEIILEKLHELLEEYLGVPYTLKVIDVLTHPEQAEIDQVSATPTLVKIWPHPVRRIVGNLDNVEKVLQTLGKKDNF
ncbi:circadian clock protein KaiB [Cylindrospermopsis raciborskii CS-508]|uniref:circadian clock KaiB family protein n=1 Tax=Cylindrospermopsis raciborskii TaxID=77022 RepID=UPI0008DD65D9|nr:circadian clock KaiB family protein [Cylindrospermopsis raciborskii]OHY31658.1 circadian clock protein KaiB [Cylindrospermopsis raciborskii CS-508]